MAIELLHSVSAGVAIRPVGGQRRASQCQSQEQVGGSCAGSWVPRPVPGQWSRDPAEARRRRAEQVHVFDSEHAPGEASLIYEGRWPAVRPAMGASLSCCIVRSAPLQLALRWRSRRLSAVADVVILLEPMSAGRSSRPCSMRLGYTPGRRSGRAGWLCYFAGLLSPRRGVSGTPAYVGGDLMQCRELLQGRAMEPTSDPLAACIASCTAARVY